MSVPKKPSIDIKALVAGMCLGGLITGGGAYYLQYRGISSASERDKMVENREVNSSYTFVNPLLSCGEEYFSRKSTGEILSLEEDINKTIEKAKKTGAIQSASVYIREFNGGYPLGINENELFSPGSMLKVPLAMSIYKKAEKDPALLKEQVLYEGGYDANASEHFKSEAIVPGTTYTVEQLVEFMLRYSDNNATLLLTQLISESELKDSYANLGIQTPTMGQEYTMPVKIYASFFRVLYNATYLNREYSERLLEYLSKTDFNHGLTAGIPGKVIVAHKFGERSLDSSQLQLHDCGIVYTPQNPYLICVMMKGTDYTQISEEIRAISKTVYDYASSK